ncbi:MAG: aa3-type cytochrome c oxidase subunit IV, partial [Pseudorhodoplanes sp.]
MRPSRISRSIRSPRGRPKRSTRQVCRSRKADDRPRLAASAPLPRKPNCGNRWAEILALTGTAMADHSEVAYTTADGNDYKEHE